MLSSVGQVAGPSASTSAPKRIAKPPPSLLEVATAMRAPPSPSSLEAMHAARWTYVKDNGGGRRGGWDERSGHQQQLFLPLPSRVGRCFCPPSSPRPGSAKMLLKIRCKHTLLHIAPVRTASTSPLSRWHTPETTATGRSHAPSPAPPTTQEQPGRQGSAAHAHWKPGSVAARAPAAAARIPPRSRSQHGCGTGRSRRHCRLDAALRTACARRGVPRLRSRCRRTGERCRAAAGCARQELALRRAAARAASCAAGADATGWKRAGPWQRGTAPCSGASPCPGRQRCVTGVKDWERSGEACCCVAIDDNFRSALGGREEERAFLACCLDLRDTQHAALGFVDRRSR